MTEDLIKHYQTLLLTLGMTEERVNTLTSVEEFVVAVEMQKEINKLKQNSDPKKEPINPKILGIDMSRENAQAFAADMLKYMDVPEWDERAIMNELYKRDNEVAKDSSIPGDVVILRDAEGRMA